MENTKTRIVSYRTLILWKILQKTKVPCKTEIPGNERKVKTTREKISEIGQKRKYINSLK